MNQFEKAVAEIEDDWDGTLECENVIEFLKNAKTATVSFSQGRFIRKIRKMKELYPDQVDIRYDDHGVVTAHIPVSAIRIGIVPPREMTEEQKAEARERLRAWRESRSSEKEEASETESEE